LEIKKLELFGLKVPLLTPFQTSFGTMKYRSHIIVRLEEKGGEVGWGEVPVEDGPWYSYETVQTASHIISDFISEKILSVDIDARNFKKYFSFIRGHNMAKAGVEMALWDLEAKMNSKPLAKYIGGIRDRIESGVSIGIKPNITELLKTIESRLDEGYRRIKIKIKPGWDVDVVRKIKEVFPDIPLQVDANAAYSLKDYRTFQLLDKYDLLMIEQPLDYNDLIHHSLLASKLRTPICLDESIKCIYDAVAAYSLRSCSIINIKPARVGGITESKLIHDFSQTVGIGCWIGGMLETGIGRGFLVALATLPNIIYPNDISGSRRYWKEDIVYPEWTVEKGYIKVPKGSGIGVEVIDEKLEKYTKWRKKWLRK